MSDQAAAIEEAVARAREAMEEEFGARRSRGSDSLPDIRAEIARALSTKIIRQYIRAELVEPVVKRLYDIGMGVERFDVPTMAGTIVRVPAAARTQVGALKLLLDSGIPRTNLVDDEGNRIAGVFVVGALQLDEARQLSQGDKYIGEGQARVTQLDPMAERIERGEFELVEIDETEQQKRDDPDEAAPPIMPEPDTPEQRILRRRRAKSNGNGNGNGTNGNGRYDG